MTVKTMPMSYAAGGLCVLFVVGIQAICDDTLLVWRNNNITCPDRAVCADVFVTTQELPDEAQCEERKIHHNCMCSGDSVCPFDQPTHGLYLSAQQQQFMCQEVCSLPFCGNIRSMLPVAQATEKNAARFDRKTYTRVNCRCPGHHVPNETRSVRPSPKYNVNRYVTEYICNTNDTNGLKDPCEN